MSTTIEEMLAALTPPPPDDATTLPADGNIVTLTYDPLNPVAVKIYDAGVCAVQIAFWEEKARGGDVYASKEARNWQDRRASLLGLNATTKVEVLVRDDRPPRELTTQELHALLDAQSPAIEHDPVPPSP